MKKKLSCVLLIDDDKGINFIHHRVISNANCAEEIVIKKDGKEALKFLKTQVNGACPQPELIFLDINMPKMDGWEFLNEYSKLSNLEKGEIVLLMLTTSLNPDDIKQAEDNSNVDDFINKPLTPAMLQIILKKHFAEFF
ncbi:response regulator [Cochleicola gelatinilyticus]|uniref:Histidine kinase n=1 Tax=Cochleicola gelatinilyticus TaxID=1763537 RepID=A0A167K8N6_9FLAO|nr:response regulator [Cochleicola gelatinilyticus]OAB81503.1 histidine kinase [Cochleicola gelatinilyticus]